MKPTFHSGSNSVSQVDALCYQGVHVWHVLVVELNPFGLHPTIALWPCRTFLDEKWMLFWILYSGIVPSMHLDVSKNRVTPKSSISRHRVFHYKPSNILGYPYFWKHPFISPGSTNSESLLLVPGESEDYGVGCGSHPPLRLEWAWSGYGSGKCLGATS